MSYGSPVNLQDYAPDADLRTPGILLDVDGFFPTMRGMRTLPSFRVGSASLPGCLGAYTATLASGTTLLVAGDAHHLYKLQGDAFVEWDNGVTFQTAGPWRFDVYGSDIIAVNGIDVMVSRLGSQFVTMASLSDVPPPPAAIVCVVDVGVFLIGKDSNTYNFSASFNVPLGGDYVWTASIANICVRDVPLTGTQGPLTAFKRIRGGVVAYKASSMYFGQYVGPPFYWSFVSISEDVGTANNEAVTNAGDAHFFIGRGDFRIYDGSSLSRIPSQLTETFFRSLNVSQQNKVVARYDPEHSLVEFYYTLSLDPFAPLDTKLIYNLRVNKWTKSGFYDTAGNALGVSAVVQPWLISEDSLTYEQFGQKYATYGDIPDLPYSLLFGSGTETMIEGIITADGFLATGDGDPVGGYLVTGEYGDGANYYQLSRMRPQFAVYPVDRKAKLQIFKRRIVGYPIPDPGPFPQPGIGPVAWLSKEGNFNVIATARELSYRIDVFALAEILAIQLDSTFAGTD